MTKSDVKDVIEKLKREAAEKIPPKLLRSDGTEVPSHWRIFRVGERVVIRGHTFEIKYIGETAILFELVPV